MMSWLTDCSHSSYEDHWCQGVVTKEVCEWPRVLLGLDVALFIKSTHLKATWICLLHGLQEINAADFYNYHLKLTISNKVLSTKQSHWGSRDSNCSLFCLQHLRFNGNAWSPDYLFLLWFFESHLSWTLRGFYSSPLLVQLTLNKHFSYSVWSPRSNHLDPLLKIYLKIDMNDIYKLG